MLEGVVKQYDICIGSGLVISEPFYALATVFVNSNIYVVIFALHLERFVTDHGHCRVFVCQHIATALALVASA